jgi:hypothetical protein
MDEKLKGRIIDDLYHYVMEGIENAIKEEEKIISSFNEINPHIDIPKHDYSTVMCLIEDRVLDAIHNTLEDMLKEGEIVIK